MTRKEEIEARKLEIREEVETTEDIEKIQELNQEVETLNEEERKIDEHQENKEIAEKLEEKSIAVKEVVKEEKKMENNKEFRNSKEYIDAFAEYIKTNDDKELRALITTGGYSTGNSATVEVPDMVYDIVKTAWEREELIQYVKTVSVKGNLKVQFEVSGDAATVHTEGNGAVSEESLVLGVVELPAKSIKKWISVSDEVLDMTGEAFLRYIYDELTYKIMAKAEEVLINKIKSLPETATATSVSAKKVKAGADVTTIIAAKGKLNAEAKNIVAVMSPATQSAFEAASVGKNFAMDPFRGVKVITTNALPDIDVATENQVYAIIGDFGFGALANFPAGDSVEIKIDDKGKMKSDLVDILGREFIAVEPIANRAFVNITKPAAI